MGRFFNSKSIVTAVWLGLLSCSSGGGATFEQLVNEGWAAFAQGDYNLAADRFSAAESKNAEDAQANTGRGWSLFQLDQLANAESAFRAGRSKMNATADLFAGWAFVLNALKQYSNSNQQADQTLRLDADWSFSHGLPLDANSLHLLKAENFFLLGEFDESLLAVQVLNDSFTADVTTASGQSALAAEIERLRTNSVG